MSWSKVGQSTFTLSSGAGTETKTLPGSPAKYDIAIVVRACDGDLSGDGIATGGYEEQSPGPFDSFPGHSVMTKVLGADTDVEISQNADFGTAGVVQVWRFTDKTIAIDGTATAAFGSSGMPNPPEMTTVTDGALRVITGHLDDDAVSGSVTAPSGYGDLLAADTTGATVMIASKTEATAGADDPAAFGGTGTDAWRGVHFAIAPADIPPLARAGLSHALGLGL